MTEQPTPAVRGDEVNAQRLPMLVIERHGAAFHINSFKREFRVFHAGEEAQSASLLKCKHFRELHREI
ncbi:hypothetical protein ASD88_14300 [Pelomonas sp. Root662]|nr:hypothetical protein ASC81_15775 [Pelomonas sp. Root405]KRA70996.1 hypothetical protein ASD88_14300 [Pelomonas sp. Root662]